MAIPPRPPGPTYHEPKNCKDHRCRIPACLVEKAKVKPAEKPIKNNKDNCVRGCRCRSCKPDQYNGHGKPINVWSECISGCACPYCMGELPRSKPAVKPAGKCQAQHLLEPSKRCRDQMCPCHRGCRYRVGCSKCGRATAPVERDRNLDRPTGALDAREREQRRFKGVGSAPPS